MSQLNGRRPVYSGVSAEYAASGHGGLEIQLALGLLPLREPLMFRLALFAGVRPGGIHPDRIGDLKEKVVHVEQRVYRRKVDSRKGSLGLAGC